MVRVPILLSFVQFARGLFFTLAWVYCKSLYVICHANLKRINIINLAKVS